MTPTNFAGLFILVAGAAVLFHISLILGAPWGHLTQGRTQRGPLPPRARLGAVTSILILLMMCGALLSVVGRWPGWAAWTGWATVATIGVGVLLNGITPSKAERALWLPVSIVMFFLALGVMVL